MLALATIALGGILAASIVPTARNGSRNSSSNTTVAMRDESILAYVKRRSTELGGAIAVEECEIRGTKLSNSSTGFISSVECKVLPCLGQPGACIVGEKKYDDYIPGCCLGPDCTEDKRCRENCPPFPESCFLTDPTDKEWYDKNCYTCNKVEGEEIWTIFNFIVDVDCVRVGTAIRQENNQKYKWAILCGRIVEGGNEDANYGVGEYACHALRVGAGLTQEGDGLMSIFLPCQCISLGECGCAPADVSTYGLPPPTGPCLPCGACPYLCGDAGPEFARNSCHAFPGIDWFEGNDTFGINTFTPAADEKVEELEIYIKGDE